MDEFLSTDGQVDGLSVFPYKRDRRVYVIVCGLCCYVCGLAKAKQSKGGRGNTITNSTAAKVCRCGDNKVAKKKEGKKGRKKKEREKDVWSWRIHEANDGEGVWGWRGINTRRSGCCVAFARKHGKRTGVWGTIGRMGWVFSVSLDG